MTVLISAAYGIIGAVFTAYDIKSDKTQQTVTTGAFNMFISLLW